MRRLTPPTLTQWGCAHRWHTHTSRPGQGVVLRVRYLVCRQCELRVKSEERLTVPYDARDLLALVRGLLPEGQRVYLRERGVTTLPLYRLNMLLEPLGYGIHPDKVRDPHQVVACTDKHGRVERFGLFELQRTAQEPPGRTTGGRRGDSPLPSDRGTERQRERRTR